MENELYGKVLKSLTDPAAILLFIACIHFIREGFKKDAVIAKLLSAQESRGVILTKITVMLEAMFNDSRRPK